MTQATPRKAMVRRMFDSIAPDYDAMNHLMSLNVDRRWRKVALRQILDVPAGLGRPWDVLDVACGTGDFSLAIAKGLRRLSLSGHVTGLDLSEGMLDVMRGKVAKAGLETLVGEEIGDCEALGFDDSAFDRVTVAFGVRNFEDREKGLREVLRVLRPGGRFVMLELSVPSAPVLRWLFEKYFFAVAKVGGRLSGDAASYGYLPASVVKFPRKDEWLGFMQACGFANVRHRALTFGVCRLYTGEKP